MLPSTNNDNKITRVHQYIPLIIITQLLLASGTETRSFLYTCIDWICIMNRPRLHKERFPRPALDQGRTFEENANNSSCSLKYIQHDKGKHVAFTNSIYNRMWLLIPAFTTQFIRNMVISNSSYYTIVIEQNYTLWFDYRYNITLQRHKRPV